MKWQSENFTFFTIAAGQVRSEYVSVVKSGLMGPHHTLLRRSISFPQNVKAFRVNAGTSQGWLPFKMLMAAILVSTWQMIFLLFSIVEKFLP